MPLTIQCKSCGYNIEWCFNGHNWYYPIDAVDMTMIEKYPKCNAILDEDDKELDAIFQVIHE